MARRVELSEFKILCRDGQMSIKHKYPWSEWLDGHHWFLERGVDYLVTDKSFENTVYRMKPHFGRIKLHKCVNGFVLIALDVLPEKDPK